MRSLSEQEALIDRQRAVVVPRSSNDSEEESEAKKIREAWLAKQDDAAGPPASADAIARAGEDGRVGDRSPVRATFVHAASLSSRAGDISECAASDDFHSALDTPTAVPRADPLASPRHATPEATPDSTSAAVSEKVSRWLRTSADGPSTGSRSRPALTVSPRSSVDEDVRTPLAPSPAGTMRPRKEKPPPIVVTPHRPSREQHDRPHAVAVAVAVAVSAPSDSDATASSEGRPSLEARGRGAATPPRLAHSSSAQTNTSRAATLPALSPTRTVSSSGAESALPTPTTLSCARDRSVSRASIANSSDTGHSHGYSRHAHAHEGRPRRGTGDMKAKPPTSGAAAVIMEEFSETEPSEDGCEFGAQPAHAHAPLRMPHSPAADARKSFSLFGKKSLEVRIAPQIAARREANFF